MLKIIVKCDECNIEWTDERSDAHVMSLLADKHSAALEFECKCSCDQKIPVAIKPDENGGTYLASYHGGFGDVTLSKFDDPLDLNVSNYLEEVVSEDPKDVFDSALNDVGEMMENIAEKAQETEIVKRLIFSQLFSIFETYLADRLIRLIERDDDALESLVVSHESWSTEKISFKDAFNAVEVVRKSVIKNLSTVLFHNFPKVDGIYKAVFDTSIFVDPEHKKSLCAYTQVRHDCVHRNGKTVAGNPRPVSYTEISDLLKLIRASNDLIEAAYAEKYPLNARQVDTASHPLGLQN